MIYGMYLSATGLATTSHQQDVIANNLANAETNGFKRQMEIQTERQVESKVAHISGTQNKLLDAIGGGQLTAPSYTDFSQGVMEDSNNNFDAAVFGKGFMAVKDGGETRLTRSGSFMLDKNGNLLTNIGQPVLDTNKNPIKLAGYTQSQLTIALDGKIKNTATQDTVAQIGLFEPTDEQSLKPMGRNVYGMTANTQLSPATGSLQQNTIEKSNIDPTTEMTRLMETQRLLELNAKMIGYQDQSLGRAVNDVGKIS